MSKDTSSTILPLEDVLLDQLQPHPRNYQTHPDDEVEHLMESIRSNEIYKNIVLASDGVTILAGHGVVLAAKRLGLARFPAYRSKWDKNDPRAIKLLAGDNAISHLAEVDDRLLTELLRELKESEVGLLGTGYDDMMLANLVMVTRPAHEIEDLDAAAQWVGMPEYNEGPGQIQINVHFANDDDFQQFCQLLGFDPRGKVALHGARKSFWWPPREKDDVRSVYFVQTGQEGTHA